MAKKNEPTNPAADDPGKNDDSQPSVTTTEQVLRLANEAAGIRRPRHRSRHRPTRLTSRTAPH